jgi:hypothetical protein
VKANTGRVLVDLTEAEFDDRQIDLDVFVNTGSALVVVPDGVDIQFVALAGTIRNRLGPITPLPGAPTIRLRAKANTGTISLCHPEPPKRRWWRRH